jgi:anti-sigma factor RsiW
MTKPNASCGRARERFALLLDGEGSEKEREEARAHIAGCAECALEWRETEALRTAIRGASPVPTEEERLAVLAAARPLLAGLRSARDPEPALHGLRRVLLFSGAAAAAVLLATLLLHGHGPELRSADVRSYYEFVSPESGSFPLSGAHLSAPF